ncbi:MAG: LLM class flavin-dependent oxidoreductase [Rhodothermales bacterium]|nr:LLM class flavin-dependent oxidoreductase [Rhodothermales bacterium]
MELGIYTFVENTADSAGMTQAPADRMSDLLEEMRLADEVGLDVFAIGEHHRPEYLASSPSTILAAGAAVTKRIRLSSAVTVLGSEDPVRVFQQFATLDLISGGRAEIMAGRGSFIESFPLFGNELGDYDRLFAEKLDLLLRLREEAIISWEGEFRPSIDGRGVYPRPVQETLPVWLAVGGTPASAVRAGTLGLPLALAIIGGNPSRFKGFADLYRKSLAEAGNPLETPMSINAHGFVAEDARRAADIAYPPFAETMNRIGAERGWPPTSRAHFDHEVGPNGALLLGNPEQVAEKIIRQHALFKHDRTLIQLSVGTIPHKEMMKAIELLGTKVAPLVQAETVG